MARFVLKRLGLGIVLLWLVVTVVFLALHAVPGDPAAILLGSEGAGSVTPEALARVRSQLGLDKPILVQYTDYLLRLVRFDLGTSFRSTDVPVLSYISDRLPKTLELVFAAALLAVMVGIPLGALAARIGGLVDTLISSLTTLGISMPVYVIGTILVLVFSLQWGMFPAVRPRDCGPGLGANGAIAGLTPGAGVPSARDQELVDPGCDHAGPGDRHPAGFHRPDRAGLHLAGHGFTANRRG